jgi:hypothetical protein
MNATATSDFVGLGFRYVAGDVSRVGFASDLSFGLRTVTIRQGGSEFTMRSTELFRLGLGAEIRLSTLFTLSPMFTLSGGVMTDTKGSVTFRDGQTTPFDPNGETIRFQRGYVVVGLGCGAHFDLFGR